MNYPKLSIVVVTYNRAHYLEECLDSIISQNYPNIEIIITDDNSNDDTETICKKYVKKYPFIKYYKNTRYPQGPNGNKNNGLDFATGEYIGILDDDDFLEKNVLYQMVDKLLEGYDIVMGNCQIVSKRRDNGEFSGYGLYKSSDVNYKKFLCGEVSGEHWSIFKSTLLGKKRFDTDLYGGEGTLWRGMLKNAKVYYIHKSVRKYRIHNDNISHNMVNKAERVIKNYERDIEYYGEEMKKECPCYLSSLYKYAAYFAKLSSQYKKGFKYLFKSLSLCVKEDAVIMLFVMFLPKNFVPFLYKIRVKIKEIFE